jgi:hypothetical protein
MYALLLSGHVSLCAPDLVYLSGVWGLGVTIFCRELLVRTVILEDVCDKSGFSTSVCKGGPFLRGYVRFLARGQVG